MFSKGIKFMDQNIRKQIDCKRPLNTKQMNRVENIHIEIYTYNQERLVLAVFASTKLSLNYIMQDRCN